MFAKRVGLVSLSVFLLHAAVPASAAPLPFPDMEWSWYRYREAVDSLVTRGVVGGYPDGTFGPKQTINRAELLKIVFKGKSDVVPVQRRCFSDVSPDEWYAPYVCAAQRRGIVNGYPNGTFRPGEPVNAAEAIKIVLNAYGRQVTEATGPEWYVPYANELDENGILARHSYVPWEPLNRERAADLLYRMLRFDEEKIIPRYSPGCGHAKPGIRPSSVDVKGTRRDFLLTVPSSYVVHDPAPLIVAFHGRTNSNEQVRSYYRLDREATDAIIAYPAALSNGNGSFSWSNPGDKGSELRDIAFFDAIVEQLANDYCIDMDDITVVGHSLGAWMANSVACVRGDAVKASATVGGDSVITDCAGPSSAMIIHNPRDRLSPFSGAERVRQTRVEENFCSWDITNSGPEELNCVTHAVCAGGNIVLWCPHTNDKDERGVDYPHNWPRDTARHIIKFFQSIR